MIRALVVAKNGLPRIMEALFDSFVAGSVFRTTNPSRSRNCLLELAHPPQFLLEF